MTDAIVVEKPRSAGSVAPIVVGAPAAGPRPLDRAIAPPRSSRTAASLLRGTSVATLARDVAVEELRPGDLVFNVVGRALRVIRTRWRVASQRGAQERSVRICANAIAPRRPRNDLVLRPGHALYIDGMLVEAGLLVNGQSILLEPIAHFSFWDVAFEQSGVVLADDVPVASWLDHTARPMVWLPDCPPLLHAGSADDGVGNAPAGPTIAAPLLAALQDRLKARAADVRQSVADTAEPSLVTQGRRFRPIRDGADRYVFHLPACSGAAVLQGAAAVRQISIHDQTGRREIGPDDPALCAAASGSGFALPMRSLNGLSGPVRIVVTLAPGR